MNRTTAFTLGGAAMAAVALVLAGLVLPNWILFTMTKATGYGLVALGIVTLMRGGLVSFGQGLVYCLGAYASGLLASRAGVTDIFVLLAVGGAAGMLMAAIVAPLVARYRGIFFAMLSLALSMVLYGVLSKMTIIGGSDGFNVPRPTYLGYLPGSGDSDFMLYLVGGLMAILVATLLRFYFDSMAGLVALAVRENELRVEYLGASVFWVTVRHVVIAGTLGGLGGALNGFALGHVDPFFSYWTTSGEVVFIAILAGHASVGAVFLAAFATEMVRSFANQYFPESWQLFLGAFLLLVMLFLPNGIGSVWVRKRRRRGAPAPPATPPAREPAE